MINIENPFVLLKPEGVLDSRRSFTNFFEKEGFRVVKELEVTNWPNVARAIYHNGSELEAHLRAMKILFPDSHLSGRYLELKDDSKNSLEKQYDLLNKLKYKFRESLEFTRELEVFYRGDLGNFKIYLNHLHVPDTDKFSAEMEVIRPHIKWN